MFEANNEVYNLEVSELTNDQLSQGHNALMECNINVSFWQELDAELCFRCEEEETMTWPYNS